MENCTKTRLVADQTDNGRIGKVVPTFIVHSFPKHRHQSTLS